MKFLVRASYVGDGIKGLMREGGSKRLETVRASVESAGGSLESMYFAFGETDVFAIGDFPDAASAGAWSLAINATGAVRLHLTPLMTPEDIDAMSAKTVSYRAPGAS